MKELYSSLFPLGFKRDFLEIIFEIPPRTPERKVGFASTIYKKKKFETKSKSITKHTIFNHFEPQNTQFFKL